MPAGPLKRRLEAAETTLARETTALAAIDAELSDPALYAKPAGETARLTARRAQLADRLAKAEAIWLAAAEAYETSASD
jgi:ATP-binding cassette subfamily F protein 3